MNTAALTPRPCDAPRFPAAPAWARAWNAVRLTLSVIVTARDHVDRVQAMQRLLRQSNACEATSPVRAAALTQEAANLAD